MHSIYTIEKVSDSPASTNNGAEAGHITADNDDIITHPEGIVNTQDEKSLLSDRESDILYSDRVTDKRTLEALKKPVDNVTEVNILASAEEIKDFDYFKDRIW